MQVRPSELGTAPVQVVQYAKTLFEHGDRHKNIQRRAFEKVYAVFDRDDHNSYLEALNVAASLDGKLRNDAKQLVVFQAIASVPSFEQWLLLHFEDVQAPHHRDQVMSRLKLYIPDYDKGTSNAFAVTCEHLSVAIRRADRLKARFTAHSNPEPFTGVVELVKLLTTLRD